MSKVYNAAGAHADCNANHNRNSNPYSTRTLSLVVVGSVCVAQLTQLRSSYEERMQRMVPAKVKQVCNCVDNVKHKHAQLS